MIKGWVYLACGIASLLMLIYGLIDRRIAIAQTAVLPVLAWMNFDAAKRST